MRDAEMGSTNSESGGETSVGNVNVGEEKMGSLPCFLCGCKLEKRVSKNSKPYFVCDPCGVQLFVRRKQGIERLENLFRTSEQNAILLEHAAQRVYEVQAMLKEIEGTKAQIKTLDDEIGLFFRDEDKIRTRNALKTKLDNLLQGFEEYCANARAKTH